MGNAPAVPADALFVDGIGRATVKTPWSSTELPRAIYWTGTKVGDNVWTVYEMAGRIIVGPGFQDARNRTICVPPSPAKAQAQVTQPQPQATPVQPQKQDAQPQAPQVPAAASGVPAGFIAVADTDMTWGDARAWCEARGGRLPRINGEEVMNGSALTGRRPSGTVSVDGIGKVTVDPTKKTSTPWSATGLPSGPYWTDTQRNDPGLSAGYVMTFREYEAFVSFGSLNLRGSSNATQRVACVP
jgi:hypothetical protein